MPDPRALKILFDTYWSPRGWKSPAQVSPEDFEFARAAGVMFDTTERTHDALIAEAIESRERHALDSVTSAFAASLSSHRLEWRSALGSYALLAHLRPHPFFERPGSNSCAYCGLDRLTRFDRSVLNFERFKWGGVRHLDVGYAAFDLGRFSAEPAPAASSEDADTLRRLLEALRSSPSAETATELIKRLTKLKLPRGANDERASMLDVLGLAGVLRVRGRPSFLESFTPFAERELPAHRFVERAYPVCWWRGTDGLDEGRIVSLFGPGFAESAPTRH